MNRVNQWLAELFDREAEMHELWNLYAGAGRLHAFNDPYSSAMGDDGSWGAYFPFERDGMAMFRVPPGVRPENWQRFLDAMNESFRKQSSLAFETWVMAGMCNGGPRVYCPSAADYMTLSRTECNYRIADYRQPFHTFIVEVPGELYPGPIGSDFGRPAAIVGRHSPEGKLMSMAAWGTGSDRWINLTIYLSYGKDDTVTAEELLLEQESAPSLAAQFYPGHEPLNDSEQEFFQRAKRAYLNSCMMLTHYGAKPVPANPEFRARLERTLANKNAPAGAKAEARKRIERMPLNYVPDQVIALRVYESDGESGDGTGRHTRPHWRRGHWSRQHHGPGNLLVKTIFRPEVFVNRGRVGLDGTPSTVTYTSAPTVGKGDK